MVRDKCLRFLSFCLSPAPCRPWHWGKIRPRHSPCQPLSVYPCPAALAVRAHVACVFMVCAWVWVWAFIHMRSWIMFYVCALQTPARRCPSPTRTARSVLYVCMATAAQRARTGGGNGRWPVETRRAPPSSQWGALGRDAGRVWSGIAVPFRCWATDLRMACLMGLPAFGQACVGGRCKLAAPAPFLFLVASVLLRAIFCYQHWRATWTLH